MKTLLVFFLLSAGGWETEAGPVRLTDVLRGGGGGGGSCTDLFCGQCPVDCMGVPGGAAVEDEFNTCCKRRDLDCAGVCNGTAAIDVCGDCSGGTTGKIPGAGCLDRPEGCTVWCIISIVLLSTAAIGAFLAVTCVCCWVSAAAVDRPWRGSENLYGGRGRGRGEGEGETEGLVKWDKWDRQYFEDQDGTITERDQRRGRPVRRRMT